MPSKLQTHLTLLEDAYKSSPQTTAYLVPNIDKTTGQVDSWNPISYAQLRTDVMKQASYWSSFLKDRGVHPGSVITLWLKGLDYRDVTLIFGISRAGYTAELVSFSIPSPEAVYDVAQRANSKLLIHDSSQSSVISSAPSPLPIHCHDMHQHDTVLATTLIKEGELPVLEDMANDPNDAVFILHTSGSTSGVPKLVPWSWRWIDGNIEKVRKIDLLRPKREGYPERYQIVQSWMGTMCHAGQLLSCFLMFIDASTLIQPSTLTFPSSELILMSRLHSLTTLAIFPALFMPHLKRARQDPELLDVLRGLGAVTTGGMALGDGDVEWCVANGVPLQSLFGSTEVGMFLRTVPGKPVSWFRPLEQGEYRFDPVGESAPSTAASNGRATSQATNGHVSSRPTGTELFEFVVLSHSKDCPDVSLRSKEDGHFHTGDLFEAVPNAPGYYENRGRGDDWIKLLFAGRCDTRAIESNALELCPDLIHNCVATGTARLCVVLFVEPLTAQPLSPSAESELKEEILRRIAPGQLKMWAYEKIERPEQIYVAVKDSLPRTGVKGNIRRREVEAMFKGVLDGVYERMGKA